MFVDSFSASSNKRMKIPKRITFPNNDYLDVVNGLFLWKWHICSLILCKYIIFFELFTKLVERDGASGIEITRETNHLHIHVHQDSSSYSLNIAKRLLTSTLHAKIFSSFSKFTYLFRSFLSIVMQNSRKTGTRWRQRI